MRGFLQFGKIYLSIDYTDFSVAQHLESIVNTWRKNLPEKKVGKFYKLVMRNEGQLGEIVPVLASMSALVSAAWYVSNSGDLGVQQIAIVAFAIALSYGLRCFVSIANEFAFSTLKQFIPGPTIILTRGDKEKVDDISKRMSKAKKILAFITLEIAAAFSVGVLSAWAYDKFFSGS